MRKWIWIAPLALVVATAGAAFSAVPWAKKLAHEKAQARGLELSMQSFSLGWMSAKLGGVELRPEGTQGVVIRLQEVEVDLSLSGPRLRRVFVQGGHLQLEGSVETLQAELEAWQSRRPQTPPSQASSGPRRIEILRNLDVTWTGAFGPESEQRLRGLHLERDADGQRLGIDLVHLERGPLSLDVAGASLKSAQAGFNLSQAKYAGAAEMRVTLDARDKAAPDESSPSEPPSEKSTPTIDAPTPAADLDEKSASGEDAGLGSQLQKDTARVTRLLFAMGFMREKVIPRLPPAAQVDKLEVTYLSKNGRLQIGPSKLRAEKAGETFKVGIIPGQDTKGTPLSFNLQLNAPSAKQAAKLDLTGGPISLRTLGIKDGAFGLTGVTHTTVAGTIQASLSQDAQTLSASGEASVEGLSLESQKLAEGLVSFPRVVLKGKGQLAVDGSMMQLKEAEVSLGEARFQGDFQIEKEGEHVKLLANAKAPLLSCQALLDSAPRGLLGPVERIAFDGTFSLDAGVEADTRHLKQMKVRWNFKNGCRAKAVPAALDPERFRGLFQREVVGAGNFPMQLEFGPHSPGWVPYDEVSPFIEAALLVSEDGRFFRHNGFDDRAIESSIRDNTRAGRFVRGASTISMQLAKNLYLSRDKTMSRKLQEAALTSLLEQSFEKKELLELYVNIVEFGPGIYGIRAAAEHYFGTHPGRLTPAQAFFLVSILPAPTREYFEADGKLTEARAKYVRYLLSIAEKRGRLSPAELEEAQSEELVFGQSNTSSTEPEEGAPESPGTFLDNELPAPGALAPHHPTPSPERPGLPL